MDDRTVYVVGAGLSAGLGFPTISDLLPSLWARISSDKLRADLAAVIRFHHPDFNERRIQTFPDIETLLSELDANAHLFGASRVATGGFTQEKLLDVQRLLLLEMSDWFHSLMPSKPPRWLRKLIWDMKYQRASIVSFNYDLVLDRWMFGNDLNASSYGFAASSGAKLLKPHGSLNWFTETSGRHIRDGRKFKLGGAGNDAVFVFRKFRAPVSKSDRQYHPLIIPPVFSKRFEGPVFENLWRRVVSVVSTASRVVFLGYSLPPADFHARFALRCGFYNQVSGEILHQGGRAPATGRALVEVVDMREDVMHRVEHMVGYGCRQHVGTIQSWIES